MANLQSTVGNLRNIRGFNRGVDGDTLITLWDLSQKPISEIKAGDEIAGHFVYGHVDCATNISKINGIVNKCLSVLGSIYIKTQL